MCFIRVFTRVGVWTWTWTLTLTWQGHGGTLLSMWSPGVVSLGGCTVNYPARTLPVSVVDRSVAAGRLLVPLCPWNDAKVAAALAQLDTPLEQSAVSVPLSGPLLKPMQSGALAKKSRAAFTRAEDDALVQCVPPVRRAPSTPAFCTPRFRVRFFVCVFGVSAGLCETMRRGHLRATRCGNSPRRKS